MAAFYFFTDYDLLNKQTSEEAFGYKPAGNSLPKRYQLTSLHTANKLAPNNLLPAFANAYSVCNGKVFVIPNSYTGNDPNHQDNCFNLILFPDYQPEHQFPSVKYIIYRGIWRPSIMPGTNLINLNQQMILPSGTLKYRNVKDNATGLDENVINSFVERINFVNNGPASYKTLGAESATYDPDFPLDNVVNREKEAYQLYTVPAGFCLGKFTSKGFGIEIVFDSTEYNPTFQTLIGNNKDQFTLEYETILQGFPQDALTIRNRREITKHYLDPCAFYGSFITNGGIFARKSTDLYESMSFPDGQSIVVPQFTLLKKDLYKLILKKFYNSNKVYIDIRNPENRSLNYSNNLDNTILINILQTDLGETAANDPLYDNQFNPVNYYKNGDWPVLTLDGSDFKSLTTTEIVQVALALPDDKGIPYSDPDLPPPIDPCDNSVQFSSEFHLYHITEQSAPLRKIVNLKRRTYIKNGLNYFKELRLKLANVGFFDTPNTKEPLPTYYRLLLAKDLDIRAFDTNCKPVIPDFNPITPRRVESFAYLDNLFTPFSMFIPGSLTPHSSNKDPDPASLSINVYYETHYIDNSMMASPAFFGFRGIAEEASGDITLFAYSIDPLDTLPGTLDGLVTISSGSGFSGTFLEYINTVYTAMGAGTIYRKLNLSIPGVGVKPLEILAPAPVLPLIGSPAISLPNPKNLAWLKIPKAGFEQLRKINFAEIPVPATGQPAGFIDPSRSWLGLEVIKATGMADDNSVSPPIKNVSYAEFELLLRGEALAPDGKLYLKTIRTGIKIYRIDNPGAIIPGAGTAVLSDLPVIVNSMSPVLPFPSSASLGSGYSVNQPIPGEYSIISTIYLTRPSNMSDEQYCLFRDDFQRIIRQTWTNNPAKNKDCLVVTKNYLNHGLSNHFVFDSENVRVIPAPARALTRLNDREILFLLFIPSSDPNVGSRAFLSGGKRSGVMYYNDMGTYTGAHEFGHAFGIKDRYTYAAVVKPDKTLDISDLSTKTAYMQPDSGYDTEFIQDYGWINNLYTYAKELPPPATTGSVSVAGYNVGAEISYRNWVGSRGRQNQDGSSPIPYFYDVYMFVTKKQMEISLSTLAVSENDESGMTSLARRYFDNYLYVLFMSSPFNGTFIGNVYDPVDGKAINGRTDSGYLPTGTPADAVMESRVNPVNPVVGAFSPMLGTKGFDESQMNDNIFYREDIRLGGKDTIIYLLQNLPAGSSANVHFLANNIDVEISASRVIDLTGQTTNSRDVYANYGEAWGEGRNLWNKTTGNPITQNVKGADGQTYKIIWKEYINRLAIFNAMQ